MVLFRSSPSVGQLASRDPQYLHLNSRSLINPALSEKKLWDLHIKYGASLRNLFLFANNPKHYKHLIKTQAKQLSPWDLIKLLRGVTDPTCDYLISTRPLPTNRARPERKVASEYILKVICKHTLQDQLKEIRTLYNTLQSRPATSAAAGMVFKSQIHRFLQEERAIDLFPVLTSGKTSQNISYHNYTATENGINRKQVALPKSKGLAFSDEPGITLKVNTYYHPQKTNFPTNASWLLIQSTPPILLMFQIILNGEEHNIGKSGLDKVGKLVAAGVQKYLVIVTPMGVKPKITVPGDYLTDTLLGSSDPGVAFSVYHCQISDDTLFQPPSLDHV